MYLDLNSWFYNKIRDEALTILDQLSESHPVITHDTGEAATWFPELLEIITADIPYINGLKSGFYASVYDPTKVIRLSKRNIDCLVGLCLAVELVTLPKTINGGLGVVGRYSIREGVPSQIRGTQGTGSLAFVRTDTTVRELLAHLTVLRVMDTVSFMPATKREALTEEFFVHHDSQQNPDDPEALKIQDLGMSNALLSLTVFNDLTAMDWTRYRDECINLPANRDFTIRGNIDSAMRAGALDRAYFLFSGLSLIPGVGAALAAMPTFMAYSKLDLLIEAYESTGVGRQYDEFCGGTFLHPDGFWTHFTGTVARAAESIESEEDFVLLKDPAEALEYFAINRSIQDIEAQRKLVKHFRNVATANGFAELPDQVIQELIETCRATFLTKV